MEMANIDADVSVCIELQSELEGQMGLVKEQMSKIDDRLMSMIIILDKY
ncbi:MAG: hypothetical protein AB9919_12250 [Geobacteraceae bacterium]